MTRAPYGRPDLHSAALIYFYIIHNDMEQQFPLDRSSPVYRWIIQRG